MKNNLKLLRVARGWTQANLASHLGVSRQTINSIERDRLDASLPLALKIGRLFQKQIDQIFFDEESKVDNALDGQESAVLPDSAEKSEPRPGAEAVSGHLDDESLVTVAD